jgi:transcriptional regulator with XRE-family HTH domain
MTSVPTSSETIGQRLKRLRLERGLSQRELASPGVSYAYISRIEAGTRQPSVKALRRLAAKLSVTAEYLETGSDLDDMDARELRIADAELSLRLEHSPEAEATLRQVLEESLAAGDTVHAARARIALGFVAAERGDHHEAASRLEAAIDVHRPAATERPDVYATLGRAYSSIGAPERAADLFERCLDEVTSHDPTNTAAQIRYASLLSYALSDMGDLARAESVVRDALERSRGEEEDPYVRVRLYWSLARLSGMEGKSAAALHHVRRAIALLEATEDTIHLARAHVLCAWIMTSQGNPEPATKHLDTAERLLGAHPSPDDEALIKVERARAAAASGDGATAVDLARQAVELLGDRNPAELGLAFAALGEGLGLEGEPDASTEAFRRSVDLLETQRRWREATQACQAWGKMLRRSGRESQALDVLERASELRLRATPATTASAR